MKCRPATPSVRSVPGGGDVDLLATLDPLGEPVALVGGPLPGAERVGIIGEAGVEVEVLEVAQAHLGVRGVGVGGKERVDPAVRSLGGALHRPLHQLASRRLAHRLALGRNPESWRVFVSAPIAIRQSASSAAHFESGETHSSWASPASR